MLSSTSNVHFIINPVSGNNDAPFALIGQYMAEADCQTTLHVTTLNHSAQDYANMAIASKADLVIAYGGDGTVMEIANCLHGHNIPLAILAGGTANVVAHELNIPVEPEEALDLIFNQPNELKWVDAGQINDTHFLLRFSIGWEAELSQRPTTEDKSKWGTLAYTKAALEALNDLQPVTYTITLDDDTVEEITGINCSICNIGNVGFYGANIGKGIVNDDGLLNVLILENKRVRAIVDLTQNLLSNALDEADVEEKLPHYKAKKITIAPSEPQRMSQDGEAFDNDFPITVECVPEYIQFLVPQTI